MNLCSCFMLLVKHCLIFVFRTINSGKSKKNEDQARVHSGVIKIPLGSSIDEKTDLSTQDEKTIDIPYRYFGIFDGHAGPGKCLDLKECIV